MPIVRILLVLFALATPALAQDGARDAAAAQEAAHAFKVYVEGVAKNGGRPDLTRPEIAARLGRVFDLDAMNALPPAQASDLDWLNRLDRGRKRSCSLRRQRRRIVRRRRSVTRSASRCRVATSLS